MGAAKVLDFNKCIDAKLHHCSICIVLGPSESVNLTMLTCLLPFSFHIDFYCWVSDCMTVIIQDVFCKSPSGHSGELGCMEVFGSVPSSFCITV